jgi:hypothetical protein
MKLTVNGAEVEVDDRHAKTPLLWVLRDVLELRGTKATRLLGTRGELTDGRTRKFQQRIDMGERAWSAAKPTQPTGDPP